MIRLIRFLVTGDWHLHEWEKDGPQISASWRSSGEPYEAAKREAVECDWGSECGEVVTNLDGDNLCQKHADDWVRGQGDE